MTVIPRACLDAVLVAARSQPGAEICGLLLGTDGRVEEARPTANVAADPARAFEIDPAALVAAHKAERSGGPQILGCYHSHPSGLPVPSPRDRAAAAEASLWLIVACGEARLWHFADGDFTERPIVIA